MHTATNPRSDRAEYRFQVDQIRMSDLHIISKLIFNVSANSHLQPRHDPKTRRESGCH